MKNLPIVLVVEDDKAIVHLLSTILDANDYRVVQVSTGREALSTISSHCPDVVLLDLGLPDMDGVDIIKNVRQWSQVPIIVLSAASGTRLRHWIWARTTTLQSPSARRSFWPAYA